MHFDDDAFNKRFEDMQRQHKTMSRVVWIGIAVSSFFAIIMSIGVIIAGGLGLKWLWENL